LCVHFVVQLFSWQEEMQEPNNVASSSWQSTPPQKTPATDTSLPDVKR
jgi:hypothetical protein